MHSYQLLDFGQGRKLECFGTYVLDRPSPAADDAIKAKPQLWSQAHASYGIARDVDSARRIDAAWNRDLPPWPVSFGPVVLESRLTPFGHVGVFPEQAENWKWIAASVERRRAAGRAFKVLNLFAHTGGATIAAAAAGAEVTHIDAAAGAVAWARRNAQLSGLGASPIRWIAEDVRRFVARELRRGNGYDAVILDPPTYGHGPKGEAWKIAENLPPLLSDCARLTDGRRTFVLLTCHSPGFGGEVLSELLHRAGIDAAQNVECGPLDLRTDDGRTLPSGNFARRWR